MHFKEIHVCKGLDMKWMETQEMKKEREWDAEKQSVCRRRERERERESA